MITLVNHHHPHIAATLHQLQQAAYQVESDLINYPNLPPLHERIETLQQITTETFLTYQINGRIVAALAYETTPTHLHISRLIVHPQHFRQGIAHNLLTALEPIATTQQTVTVTTAAKNIPAITLYQKHGYKIVTHTTLPDGLVLVYLQKNLTNLTFYTPSEKSL